MTTLRPAAALAATASTVTLFEAEPDLGDPTSSAYLACLPA